MEEMAELILDEIEEKNQILPGFGHPIHRPKDPRTEKLFTIAQELNIEGKNIQLIKKIQNEFNNRKGKVITLNEVGAMGAIYNDMGLDYRIVRAFADDARSVGFIAHISKEHEERQKTCIGKT